MDQRVCRTCLEEIIDTNYVKLDDETNGTKQKLTVCVPEMNLNVVPDACVCIYCANLLQTAYDFKQRCLRTEEKIRIHKGLSDLSQIKENIERDDKFDVVHGVGIGMEIVFIKDEDLIEYDNIPSETSETVINENDSVNWFINIDNEMQETEQLKDSNLKIVLKTNEVKKVTNTNAAKKVVNTFTKKKPTTIDVTKKLKNTNATKKVTNTNTVKKVININAIKKIKNINAIKKVSNINLMKKLTNANVIKKVTNTNSIKKVTNTNATKKVTNKIKKETNTNAVKKLPNTTAVKKVSDTNEKADSNRKSIGRYNKISEIDSNSNKTVETNTKPIKNIAITKINKVEYTCPSCNYETTVEKYYKQHMRRCKYSNIPNGSTTPDILKCSECNYQCEKTSALFLHNLRAHGKRKKLKCPKCSFATKSVQSLKQHSNSHYVAVTTNTFKYNCMKCPFHSDSPQGYQSHIRNKHRREVTFKCEQCDFTSSEKIHVAKHALKHHPKKIKSYNPI